MAGEYITLAELQSSTTDKYIGFCLILLALFHNVLNRFFIYKTEDIGQKDNEEILKVDKDLFMEFLSAFPSDSRSVRLLKDHDFGNSYHDDSTKELSNFVYTWNTAQKTFLNQEIEDKKQALYKKCNEFIYELSLVSYSLNREGYFSCIPDAYRGEFDIPKHVRDQLQKINNLATECNDLYGEFVLFSRRKLKC